MNAQDDQALLSDIHLALRLDQYAHPKSGAIANELYYHSVAKYLVDRLRTSWIITREPTRDHASIVDDWLASPGRPPIRGCTDC